MHRQSFIIWITIIIAYCAVFGESTKVKTASACALPSKEIGTCRASISRWSYDAEKGACEQFIFGGCEGNDNNFENYEDCMKTCANPAQIDPISRN